MKYWIFPRGQLELDFCHFTEMSPNYYSTETIFLNVVNNNSWYLLSINYVPDILSTLMGKSRKISYFYNLITFHLQMKKLRHKKKETFPKVL